MGNCTATIKKKSPLTPAGRTVVADVALSTSYATNGDTVPISIFGLRRLSLLLANAHTTPGGHHVEVIHGADEYTAPKLRVRNVTTGAELGAASDNSAQSVRLIAYVMPYR